MTTVSPKKNHDPAKVNEISEKLMENPELASLISELSASADDASELVKGLLQASINAGLQAEMDAHLGYSHSDRECPILCVRGFGLQVVRESVGVSHG